MDGVVDTCWMYGRSVHNQKIECFWSQFVKEWLARWRDIFYTLESHGHWEMDNTIDRVTLLYVYMPIIRQELEIHRRDYNSYPMRKNPVSRLPSGPPEDNYKLCDPEHDFSIPIPPAWVTIIRNDHLVDFNATEYLHPDTATCLDDLLLHSPFGLAINVANAQDQYLYLRDCFRRQGGA